jgi:hypothetical protein
MGNLFNYKYLTRRINYHIYASLTSPSSVKQIVHPQLGLSNVYARFFSAKKGDGAEEPSDGAEAKQAGDLKEPLIEKLNDEELEGPDAESSVHQASQAPQEPDTSSFRGSEPGVGRQDLESLPEGGFPSTGKTLFDSLINFPLNVVQFVIDANDSGLDLKSRVNSVFQTINFLGVLDSPECLRLVEQQRVYQNNVHDIQVSMFFFTEVYDFIIRGLCQIYRKCEILSPTILCGYDRYLRLANNVQSLLCYEVLQFKANSLAETIHGFAMGCHDMIYFLPLGHYNPKDAEFKEVEECNYVKVTMA